MLWSRLVRFVFPPTARVRRAPGIEAELVLRLATRDDEQAVERLAALYDRPVPDGPLLVAEVDGELQAALTLTGEHELMEPFLPTAALVELLALRAKQLIRQECSQRHERGLRRRRHNDAPCEAACEVLPLVQTTLTRLAEMNNAVGTNN